MPLTPQKVISGDEEDPEPETEDSRRATTKGDVILRSRLGNDEEAELMCSICMGDYEFGDSICWSPNPLCPHYYHAECMTEWLCKGHDECPQCRYDYLRGPAKGEKVDSETDTSPGSGEVEIERGEILEDGVPIHFNDASIGRDQGPLVEEGAEYDIEAPQNATHMDEQISHLTNRTFSS